MPKGKELEAPGVREDEVVDTTKGLGEVTSSAHVQDNVDSVLKAMGRMPLDRQKVDTWRRWLDDGDERSFKRIQRLLDTEGAVCFAQPDCPILKLRSATSSSDP
jgi:hypothetical protein